MRGLTLALALAASAACSPAIAATYVFDLNLSGAEEFPPNASPGIGTGQIVLNTTAHTMTVDVDFSGLLGTTTAAHVHGPTASPFTGTAPVATELPSFTGFPLGVSAGSYVHVFDTSLTATFNPTFLAANGGTAAGAEAAFVSASLAGRTYLNIHTTSYPGGEIRSFLAEVPEPGTWALLITGFGLTGAALRRRRPAVNIPA